MSTGYTALASCYDSMTPDVNYSRYAETLLKLTKKYGCDPSIVLDLACGTGSLSFELASRGLEVIGVDSSYDMLSQATMKNTDEENPVLFLCQSMEDLDLYGTVSAVYCCLDSVNHLSGVNALNKAFSKVGLFLEPGGIFIFDVITRERMERLSGQAFVREAEGVFCTYRYLFDPRTSRQHVDLDIFTANRQGLYRREAETVTETAFSLEELDAALARGGMDRVGLHGEFALRAPREGEERITVVAKRNGSSTHSITTNQKAGK